MYPQGGFKTQTVVQIGNVLAAYNASRISLRGIRIYFAAVAAAAARDAAWRSGRHRRRARCYFQATEIAKLCRCPAVAVRRELKTLERAGLLLFSETEIVFTTQALPGSDALIESLAGGRSPSRPVPLPRPAVRFIARCNKVAVIKTMLAYCVRGLSLSRDGVLKGKGTAKASWIADTCVLSLRAVRVARAELIAAGFITPDEGSTQWKLNRHGAYFTISMAFSANELAAEARRGSDSAPPLPKKQAESAPPYKDRKTPSGSENQKTHCREASGFCGKQIRRPRLNDIQADDLRSVSRMLALHAQAVRAGFAENSAAGCLAFLAAAVHAARVANRNAAGLFATIVRKGLWHFASQDDEDRARRCLQRQQSTNAAAVAVPGRREEPGRNAAIARTSDPTPLTSLLNHVVGQLQQRSHDDGPHELPPPAAAVYFPSSTRYDGEQQRRSDTSLRLSTYAKRAFREVGHDS